MGFAIATEDSGWRTSVGTRDDGVFLAIATARGVLDMTYVSRCVRIPRGSCVSAARPRFVPSNGEPVSRREGACGIRVLSSRHDTRPQLSHAWGRAYVDPRAGRGRQRAPCGPCRRFPRRWLIR